MEKTRYIITNYLSETCDIMAERRIKRKPPRTVILEGFLVEALPPATLRFQYGKLILLLYHFMVQSIKVNIWNFKLSGECVR